MNSLKIFFILLVILCILVLTFNDNNKNIIIHENMINIIPNPNNTQSLDPNFLIKNIKYFNIGCYNDNDNSTDSIFPDIVTVNLPDDNITAEQAINNALNRANQGNIKYFGIKKSGLMFNNEAYDNLPFNTVLSQLTQNDYASGTCGTFNINSTSTDFNIWIHSDKIPEYQYVNIGCYNDTSTSTHILPNLYPLPITDLVHALALARIFNMDVYGIQNNRLYYGNWSDIESATNNGLLGNTIKYGWQTNNSQPHMDLWCKYIKLSKINNIITATDIFPPICPTRPACQVCQVCAECAASGPIKTPQPISCSISFPKKLKLINDEKPDTDKNARSGYQTDCTNNKYCVIPRSSAKSTKKVSGECKNIFT